MQLECLGNFRSSLLGAEVVFGLAQESVKAMVLGCHRMASVAVRASIFEQEQGFA